MNDMNDLAGWHTPVPASHPAAALLNAKAVRTHCEEIFAHVSRGESKYFAFHAERLAPTAAYVAQVIRERYPDLKVPYHSRWRHFEAGGVDRWNPVFNSQGLAEHHDRDERARARIDLVIPSVLLDAGAGPKWTYRDPLSGQTLSRSEGLGVASLAVFARGLLSDHRTLPLRSDAAALSRITAKQIGEVFQVSEANPLVGLDGRTSLLRRLGDIASVTPAVFGSEGRLGNLYDYLKRHAQDNKIEAGFILETLLRALGPMWPGRMMLDGVPLGDCWPHPAATGGRVPFHKLTQWLTYSLLEPLEEAGLEIAGLDALTGLPEYRNGGLLLDLSLIEARNPSFHTRMLTVDEVAVVEWRAITVALLDRLADAVRQELKVDAASFPLARVLEGGTWAAGRKIAAEKREGGPPPVHIDSDGTVF
ncbi:MAG: URC4/urg3 family protein [Betaproteobacteria bacterium]|nr:URC4/urg3 family protein [Betaproteobacteria bacterium]